jgi:hypothetical protein
MPRAKQSRKAGARREAPEIPPLAVWFIRDVLPLLRRRRRSSKSARHLKNAGIEVLEAMRSFLDEAIECLRREEHEPAMKRIEVEE